MKKVIIRITSISLIIIIALFKVGAEEHYPNIYISDVSGKVGEIVEVKVCIENNPGITAFQLNIDYPKENLELISIDDMQLFDQPVTNSELSKCPFIISWFSKNSDDVIANGTIAILKFKILNDFEEKNISVKYDSENIFDSSFNNVFFETRDGNVLVEKKLFGDINEDGIIDIADATEGQKMVAEILECTSEKLYIIDINKDGKLTISDITIIQNYLAGNITSLEK